MCISLHIDLNLFWAAKIPRTPKNPLFKKRILQLKGLFISYISQVNLTIFKEVLDFSRCSFLQQNIKFFFCNLFLIPIEACLKKIEPNHYSNIGKWTGSTKCNTPYREEIVRLKQTAFVPVIF